MVSKTDHLLVRFWPLLQPHKSLAGRDDWDTFDMAEVQQVGFVPRNDQVCSASNSRSQDWIVFGIRRQMYGRQFGDNHPDRFQSVEQVGGLPRKDALL